MGLSDTGWARLPFDADTLRWAQAARAAGLDAVNDPDLRAKWLQCEGTWFVGVDALPTDDQGRISGIPIGGDAGRVLREHLARPGAQPLHRAQLSVMFPGYPRPRSGESAAAFRYREKRCAAHVDGLIAQGPQRQRRIMEPHAFILGLPLTDCTAGTSPLVVWNGSHRIMGGALQRVLAGHDQAQWSTVDVTQAYQQARRQVFDTCTRVELTASPGEALLLHRHTLHGIAPWRDHGAKESHGRMIAYFRPESPDGVVDWVQAA